MRSKGTHTSHYSLPPQPLYLSSGPPPSPSPSGPRVSCAPLFTTQEDPNSRTMEGRCETTGIGRLKGGESKRQSVREQEVRRGKLAKGTHLDMLQPPIALFVRGCLGFVLTSSEHPSVFPVVRCRRHFRVQVCVRPDTKSRKPEGQDGKRKERT